MKVITSWDDKQNNTIKLLYKENDVKKIKTISDFEWYFVILAKDFDKLSNANIIDRYYQKNEINKIAKDKKYIKIYSNNTFQCQNFRKELEKLKIKTFEADLSLWKRYLIDNKIEIETNLSVLFFDIETDDSNTGIEIGRDRILSWSGCDSNGKIYFRSGDEKEILKDLINTMYLYDIFSGWNSAKFDLPYIKDRMKKYGIWYDWRKRIHIDLMQRAIKLYHYDMDKIGLTGFSLDEISRVFLKKRKIVRTEKIIDLYQNNFEKFKKYNIRDSVLLYELNKKLNIIPFMTKECEWTGTLLNNFYVGEILDNYLLRESKQYQMYLSTKPTFDEASMNKEIKIIGGYVQKPKTGLYENVWIFDYKSLYPSIIIDWNIGWDSINVELSKKGEKTFISFVGKDRKIEDVQFDEWIQFLKKEKNRLDPKNKYCQTTNNHFFERKKKSFISILIEDLLIKRQKIKKKLKTVKVGSAEHGSIQADQWLVKELANSMYGLHADKRSRYFNKSIAESITITGQFLNKLASDVFKKMKIDVISGDTDSVFCPIDNKKDIDQITKIVNKKILNFLYSNFKLSDSRVYLENDKMYKKIIVVDKKRYTGILGWKDSQVVDIHFSRGIEDVKRNTIPITKEKIIELTLAITRENKQLKDIKRWLIKLKKSILEDTFHSDQITICTRISKPIAKYKSKSVHVKLAEKLIKEGKLLEATESKNSWGTQIKYIITDASDGQKGILANEYNGQWDRKYYWDIQIYAPIMRILKAVWPKEKWEEYSIAFVEKMKIKQEKEKKKLEKNKKKKKQQKLHFV